MKKLFAALFVLSLMTAPLAPPATAADTPATAPEKAAGSLLDAFTVGMSRAEAEKRGATPAGDSGMLTGKVSWDGTDWQAMLSVQDDAIVSVALGTDVKNPLVAQVIDDVAGRGCLPLGIEREKSIEVFKSPAKDADEILNAELNAYAGQDAGEIMVLFGPRPLFEALAKTASDEEQDAAMTQFAASVVYALHIDKADDKLTVVIAALKTLSE